MRRSKIQFIVQSLPAKETQFRERLESLTEKQSFHLPRLEDVNPALRELELNNIRQCIVGPKYIAFLLEDRRVCRLRYSTRDSESEEVLSESSTSKSTETKPSSSKPGERPAKVLRTGGSPWVISGTGMPSATSALRRWGTHIGVIRSMASSSSGSSSLTTSSGSNSRSRIRNQASETSGSLGSNSAAGVRLVRTSQFRGRGLTNSLLTGQRVILPASHVPEELINQVQGILQGKSRNIIIRELQRTNLDVNLAVNNLLSRDDEDNEDMDENGNDYMPGEDLLSLLDSGIHPGDHGVFIDTDVLPDDLLGYTFHRASRTTASQRVVTSAVSGSGRDQSQDRDPIIRLRSPRFFEPLSSYESDQDESAQQPTSSASKKARVTKKFASVALGDKLEWWMEGSDYAKFIQIAAMQSELAGIDVNGNLRQWEWSREAPYQNSGKSKIFHPRAHFLGLEGKKVIHLAACYLRASVLTEHGGVATWIDSSVASHASVLEHSVTDCIDPDLAMRFNSKKHRETENKCLHVCPVYSALFTTSGDIYWWGVLPIQLRKKILEKSRNKLKKTSSNKKDSADPQLEVKQGSLVSLDSCPMFSAGAKGILIRGGKPKLVCLQQSAWQFTDKCTFKVLIKKARKRRHKTDEDSDQNKNDIKGDPIPCEESQAVVSKEVPVIQSTSNRETVLKSTCAGAEESGLSRPMKRKRGMNSKPVSTSVKFDIGDTEDAAWECVEEDGEETCSVQDVIFIEDLHTNPVGKVLKVDGDMVAVLFSKSGKISEEKMSSQSILNDLRLLRKEDVHVATSNASPKIPEYILKTPRKIPLDPKLKIHAICVNERGIEAIEGGYAGLPLRRLSISMLGKVTPDALPTPAEMFIGEPGKMEGETHTPGIRQICKLDQQDQDFFPILRDRYSCLYPLIRNESFGIRDPHWLNLSPVMAVGRGAHVQLESKRAKDKKAQQKTLAVTALVFKSYRLMPMVVLHDHESIQRLMENITPGEIQAICDERCDGLRNVLHVAVSVSAPKAQNDSGSADGNSRAKKNKEPKKREAYRPLVMSSGATPILNSRESRTTSTGNSNISRSTSGSEQMSPRERVDAVNAIASAISVATQGERVGSDARFMRDMMQQFAAVLDDRPTNAASSTVPTSSPSTPLAPAIIREAGQIARNDSRDNTNYEPSSSPIPTSTWPPEGFLSSLETQGDGLNLSIGERSAGFYRSGKSSKKPKRKRSATPPLEYPESGLKGGEKSGALGVIKTLFSLQALEPNLYKLMSEKDALGHTPFMSAVYLRAYPAAIEIFSQSQIIARKQYELLLKNQAQMTESPRDCSNADYEEILMSMIYPRNSEPDANPLYVLCTNDTCSFTWTGAQHINQDIFECWTCGLTGTLCCCSECARVCHNGHDCKLKRTSPTAYCDCWEKCSCRSLVAGDVSCRASLLQKLLHETKLVDLPNGRGETMLHFLAQTVARQSVEQRQHRTHSVLSTSRSSHSPKVNGGNKDCDVPQHDLQPPTFCREAFLNLLHDWNSVRATVMSDSSCLASSPLARSIFEFSSPDTAEFLLPEEEQCMASQSGTSRLDSFTLCLLVKCSTMYLDMLLETLINQVQKSDSKGEEDKEVVHRFVRSLVRIFVVLSSCSSSEKSSRKSASRTISNMQPLKRINRAFNALLPFAVEELCEVAKALIDPVRMGIARPTQPFQVLPSHADAIRSCETAFALPLITPKRRRDLLRTTSRSQLSRREESAGTAQEGFAPDLLRIDRSVQAEVDLSALPERNVSNYQPLLEDREGDDGSEWQNEEDDDENADDKDSGQATQPVEEGHEMQGMSGQDSIMMEQNQDNSLREDSDLLPKATDNNGRYEGSQETVPVGDADDDTVEGQQDLGADNPHVAGENDVDIALLAASDVDTDTGSNHDRTTGAENQSNDGHRESSEVLYLEEDDGMSEDIAEDDCDDDDEDDDDDDDNDNMDEDDRDTLRTSDDEAATASEPEADGATQEYDDDSAGDQAEEDELDSLSEWLEFPLERAPTRLQRSRAVMPPHSMRWALGSSRFGRTNSKISDARQGTSGSSAVGSGLIYIDPLLRRTTASGVNTSIPTSGDSGKQTSNSPWFSAATANAQLARAFGICVREMATLFVTAWKGDHVVNSPLSTFLEITHEDIKRLENYVGENLAEIWKWILTVIDSSEAQLRYGQALQLARNSSHASDPSSKGRGKPQDGTARLVEKRKGISSFSQAKSCGDSKNDSNDTRQDFLSYMLSLMRSHSREHADYLPVIDVSSMRHIAYVLDGLIFFLRETAVVFEDGGKKKKKPIGTKKPKSNSPFNIGYDDTDEEDDGMMVSHDQEPATSPDELYSLAVSDVIVEDVIANAQEEFDPAVPYAQPLKTFFRRSESMNFLGCADPDPFTDPLVKALPLADKPHLLQPNARKEELFGRPRQNAETAQDPSYFDPDLPGTGMGRLKHKIPTKQEVTKVGKSEQKESKDVTMEGEEHHRNEESATSGKVQPATRKFFSPPSVDALLGRCRLTLELFTKIFLDDVGNEPKSILRELGGFEVRESKFRKEMEKLRNSQSVDLQLNVERDPHRLIMQTFKQLNQHFRRRTGCQSSLSATAQPLAVQKVKVTFKDEPGEGSGVARSFYTALSEALLSSEKLPPLDEILVPDGAFSRKRAQEKDGSLGRAGGKKLNLRSYFMARYTQGMSSNSSRSSSTHPTVSSQIPSLSPSFHKQLRTGGSGSSKLDTSELSHDKRAIGDRLLPKVNAINSGLSKKIMEMLLSLPVSELLLLLTSDNLLRSKVREVSQTLEVTLAKANDGIATTAKDCQDPAKEGGHAVGNQPSQKTTNPRLQNPDSPFSKENQDSDSDLEAEAEEVDVSTFPLFYQPGKRGFYSPAAGPITVSQKAADSSSKIATPVGYEARLNAFRNVGRIIGLCLLQNELCPLPLNRHVLKAILGRKINWHDFAFFDPVMFESMRFILAESDTPGKEGLLDALDLTFVANLLPEEGGGEVALIPGGTSVKVERDNLLEYVRRYATCRMITCCHKFMDQMKEGVFDVLPRNSLEGLTAEDLRLLANGCGRVDVRTLISYTSFNDESGKSASNTEKLTEFKRWFWSVVEHMSHSARQELLYFWTGSPALPASEDGFQPMPTITIRPPDDHHLPTANTCISRLYVPLYSSRTLLKQKLSIAIKTKNFGFV